MLGKSHDLKQITTIQGDCALHSFSKEHHAEKTFKNMLRDNKKNISLRGKQIFEIFPGMTEQEVGIKIEKEINDLKRNLGRILIISYTKEIK